MADFDLKTITPGVTPALTNYVFGADDQSAASPNLWLLSAIKTLFAQSPALVTPALGVATATSLAIGGATPGSNALAVTGTASFGAANIRGLSIGNTVGSVSIGNVTTIDIYNFTPALRMQLGLPSSSAGVFFGSGGIVQWGADSTPTTLDTTLSRNAPGVTQFGTTAANAAGSWLATSAGLGTSAAISASTWLNIVAGTTARAQIRFAASTAPTSPVDGDFWFDGTNVKIQVSGTTKTFTLL